MNTVVQKAGGSCLDTPDHLRLTLDRAAVKKGPIVVSALGGSPKVTDQLIALSEAVNGSRAKFFAAVRARHDEMIAALEIKADLSEVWASVQRVLDNGELSFDERRDALASHGEMASSVLAAAYLRGEEYEARAVDAYDLFVTGPSRSAEAGALISLEETVENIRARIRPMLEDGVIPVITGFTAQGPNGRRTTIGRNGSDLTAAIVAKALNAELHLLKDVAGVYDRFPNGIIIREMGMDDALVQTAKVIDARVAEVMNKGRVVVRSAFADDPGTVIRGQNVERVFDEEPLVVAA